MAATAVFDDPEPNHTSRTVWSECFGIDGRGRCTTITGAVRREFRRVIAELRRNTPVDTILEQMADLRISPIIRSAAEKDQDGILESLVATQSAFFYDCLRRRDILEDRERLAVHSRKNPYTEIYSHLTGHIDDPDDIEVVLDAHDVGISIDGLILLTGDFAHIASNRRIICDVSRLSEVCFLGDL